MAWRIVKQPNGMYARFSDVVDSFTHVNLSKDGAIDICMSVPCFMSIHTAEGKVNGADTDDVWGKIERDDGLNRWRDSIETIKIIHGDSGLLKEYSWMIDDFAEKFNRGEL